VAPGADQVLLIVCARKRKDVEAPRRARFPLSVLVHEGLLCTVS
jgi:hypothetical protein